MQSPRASSPAPVVAAAPGTAVTVAAVESIVVSILLKPLRTFRLTALGSLDQLIVLILLVLQLLL